MGYSDAERCRIQLEKSSARSRLTICSPYATDCILPFSLTDEATNDWYFAAYMGYGTLTHHILSDLAHKSLIDYIRHKHPSGDLKKVVETVHSRINQAEIGVIFTEQHSAQYDHAFSVKKSLKGGLLLFDLHQPVPQNVTLSDIVARVVNRGSPNRDMFVVNKGKRLR